MNIIDFHKSAHNLSAISSSDVLPPDPGLTTNGLIKENINMIQTAKRNAIAGRNSFPFTELLILGLVVAGVYYATQWWDRNHNQTDRSSRGS